MYGMFCLCAICVHFTATAARPSVVTFVAAVCCYGNASLQISTIYRRMWKGNWRFIFRRVRNIAKSDNFVMTVCPPVRMEQFGSHSTWFNEI
jgi:hypothetical protein